MRRAFWIAVPAFLLAVASGCGGAPHSLAEKFYLVVPNPKSPYWGLVEQGLNRAARDLKVTASMTGPDAYDPKTQKADLKRVIGLRPAGILVSAAHPNILNEEIAEAIAAGIPVITIDADAPGSKRLTFVGTNNYEAGLLGGQRLASELKGKGNVVVFTTAGQANLEERLSGYRKALGGTQIRITEVVDIKGDPVVAFDSANRLLSKDAAGVDAFVSLEGQSAKEVAEVMRRLKVTGKVMISMDALPPTLEAIEQGIIAATVAQRPFTMGYVALRLLADLALHKLPSLGGPFDSDPHAMVPRFVDTGVTLIDKATLAAYREADARWAQESKKQ